MNVFKKIAMENGITEEEVRREIEASIDFAWAEDNENGKLMRQIYFPNGKPTPEEFVYVMATKIRTDIESPEDLNLN